MAFYIHFWTKLGQLERVPYPTLEEAEAAAWAWEHAENARLKNLEDLILPGADRDKMISVISDEDNNVGLVPLFWGDFIFQMTHWPNNFFNKHHWADQFEAASRHISLETAVCTCQVWGCDKKNVGKTNPEAKPSNTDTPMSRDEKIMKYFSDGTSRKDIAEWLGVPYQTVCRVIRSATVTST